MFNALIHLKAYGIEITDINNDVYEQLFKVYYYNGVSLKYISELVKIDINILKTRGVIWKIHKT